jgi:hypothetical protein
MTKNQERKTLQQNNHPTLKPVALMRWLTPLVARPGSTVLDFCMGSGTTGIGALKEGCGFIGIECEERYFEIARQRLQYTLEKPYAFARTNPKGTTPESEYRYLLEECSRLRRKVELAGSLVQLTDLKREKELCRRMAELERKYSLTPEAMRKSLNRKSG